MSKFLNELISSILQIILFSLIPFIWWLTTARHKESFFSWIGLKKINGTNWRKNSFNDSHDCWCVLADR